MASNFIEKIDDILKSSFPAAYIESFSTLTFNDFQNSEEKSQEFNIKQVHCTKEIFELLNLSVLSGEYIKKTFQIEIESACKNITNIKLISFNDSPKEEETSGNSEIFLQDFNRSFLKPIEDAFSIYKLIQSSINSHINNSNHKIIFSKLEKYKDIELDNNNLLFFYCNLVIAYNDHRLSFEDSCKNELLEIRHKLLSNSLYKSELSGIIIEQKCNILLLKIELREKLSEKPRFLKIDENEVAIKEENYPCTYFKEFWNESKLHYNYELDDSSKLETRNKAKKIINTLGVKYENISLQELHLLTKYFKDFEKCPKSLTKINNSFSVKYQNIVDKKDVLEFDKKAMQISLNYLQNNEFSLKLSTEKFNTKTFNSLLNNIEIIQESTKCNNYFPFYKYLKTINKRLSELDTIPLDELKKLHVIQRELIQKLKGKFSWAKENYFLVFQLPFEECKLPEIGYNDKYKIQLFLSSSFVLPNDYESEQIKINEINDTILESYLNQIIISNEEFEKISNQVKKTELRSIEILGVFAAIIGIAITGINVLKFDNPMSAIYAFITFCSGMSFFILILIAITKTSKQIPVLTFNFTIPSSKKNISKSITFTKVILLIFAVIGIYSTANFFYKNRATNREIKSVLKTDSIPRLDTNKSKNKVDSLKKNNLINP